MVLINERVMQTTEFRDIYSNLSSTYFTYDDLLNAAIEKFNQTYTALDQQIMLVEQNLE